jgi:hypothetical protein
MKKLIFKHNGSVLQKLSPRSRVLLAKLKAAQLLKKFLAVYGT